MLTRSRKARQTLMSFITPRIRNSQGCGVPLECTFLLDARFGPVVNRSLYCSLLAAGEDRTKVQCLLTQQRPPAVETQVAASPPTTPRLVARKTLQAASLRKRGYALPHF